MHVIQATFRAKPGKAQEMADKLAAAAANLVGEQVTEYRVMVDHVADFWTVIFEARCSNIDAYFEAISAPGVRDAMAGYLDLVESGDRRIFRVVAEG
jgi:quinol monooxygenase YgiN